MTQAVELDLASALVRLSHQVQYLFADVSREADLTPQQAQLLCILARGPVGMTELSRLAHLEKSSLSGLVDRVERRGLVARIRDGSDRRACRIELTDTGARLGEATHRAIVARLDAVAAELPAAQRDLLASAVAAFLAVTG